MFDYKTNYLYIINNLFYYENIGPELNRIMTERRIVRKDIAKEVGITPTYLSAIVRKNSIDCELLDKICKAIGISASYFFDDTHGNHVSDISATTLFGNANVNITQGEVKMLKELLAEKERTIKILMAERNIDRAENESKI